MDVAVMLFAPPELARLALQAAPDAMIIIEASGIIRFANQQAGTLFGYAHDDMIGMNVERLMPPRVRDEHNAHRDEYMSHLRVGPMGKGLDLHGLRRDGIEFPVEVSLSPFTYQEGTLVAAAIRDASERHRSQRELITARALAEESRELAVRANQAKSRFLATASHDLRQPLQALALLNGTLLRMIPDSNAKEALMQQEQAIRSMSRLLNALLDISKLESGVVKPEPADFAVAMMFEELRQEFSGLAVGKGLRLDIEPSPICVHSDPALVEQVLRNLVSNAIKYTQRGKVALRCLPAPHSRVRLEVIDTGIGIAESELETIYDEFYQINVTHTCRDGYGLGLSIVKRIVDLLGVELEVNSTPGQGSTFALLLPTADATFVPASSETITAQDLLRSTRSCSRPSVLLVEDNPGVRDATRMLLQVEGFRVTAVASLEAALRAAHAGAIPDVLVTDYHLSDGRTGTQVIAAVREALHSPVKSVLVTGDTSPAIRELPRDPNLCIASKPVKAEEIVSMLRELIARPCAQLS